MATNPNPLSRGLSTLGSAGLGILESVPFLGAGVTEGRSYLQRQEEGQIQERLAPVRAELIDQVSRGVQPIQAARDVLSRHHEILDIPDINQRIAGWLTGPMEQQPMEQLRAGPGQPLGAFDPATGGVSVQGMVPPQEQKPPAGVALLQYVGDQLGLDLTTPDGLNQAVEIVRRMSEPGPQYNITIPGGYGPTGKVGASGLPEIAPLPGSQPERERAQETEEKQLEQESRQEVLDTLDQVIESMQKAPEEYGIMAPLKLAGRRATSATGQVAEALGVPGAQTMAESLREGPLAETEGVMTAPEAKVALDRAATIVARMGARGRVAQQEIENVREAFNTGEIDVETAIRRLEKAKEVITSLMMPIGKGEQPQSARTMLLEQVKAVIGTENKVAVNATLDQLSKEQLDSLPNELKKQMYDILTAEGNGG